MVRKEAVILALEDPNTLDIVLKPKDGKLTLIITDAGLTIDSQERLNKLITKLKSYVGYIVSNEFKKEYSDIKPKDVIIKVVCKNEPTEQMKQITRIMPHGDKENMIQVEFEVIK